MLLGPPLRLADVVEHRDEDARREELACDPERPLDSGEAGLRRPIERREVDAVGADVLRRRREGGDPEERDARPGRSSISAATSRSP